MATSFQKLLTDCLNALGDGTAATWSRTDRIWPWAIHAIRAFPILRPLLDDHTNGVGVVYSIAMPTDFREVISVEYPIGQTPPTYLTRKNRFDPGFYSDEGYYDLDRTFGTGTGAAGWTMYFSAGFAAGAHVKTQYLANHDETMTDSGSSYISVPDEYEDILIAYVVKVAYRERLSKYMQDPSVYQNLIAPMTDLVLKAEENYELLVKRAVDKLATSKAAVVKSDKFDRVY